MDVSETSRTQEELRRLNNFGLLGDLLADYSSGTNIYWATDDYAEFGEGYRAEDMVTVKALMAPGFCLRSRVEKPKQTQKNRSKKKAEVFTQIDVVRQMNDVVDENWIAEHGPIDKGLPLSKHPTSAWGQPWYEYVTAKCMEITCGEGPFLTTRYDTTTGEYIPLENRVGILDRKLRVVTQAFPEDNSYHDWEHYALKAYCATYGYEYQGDSLIIARLNMLLSYEENMLNVIHRKPEAPDCALILSVINHNIWQMDGLTGMTPVPVLLPKSGKREHIPCWIYDWNLGRPVMFKSLMEGN